MMGDLLNEKRIRIIIGRYKKKYMIATKNGNAYDLLDGWVDI